MCRYKNYTSKCELKLNLFFFYLVLTIGFEPTTYQVSEAMGEIDVCFEVEENNVLDIAGQAILNTVSGSAIGSYDAV